MSNGVIQSGRDLAGAVKHDLSNADRYSLLNAGKAVLMPAIGAPLLSNERIIDKMSFAKFFGLTYAIGTMMSAHPYISFPLAFCSSFAGIYLRQKDEARRAAGENPGFHEYNSLLMPLKRAFSIENIRYGSTRFFETIWGPGAAGKWWKIPATAIGVIVVAGVGGHFCSSALGTVAPLLPSHSIGYVASQASRLGGMLSTAISYIPIINAFQHWIAKCAAAVLPSLVPDFVARANLWLLIPGVATYLHDTYKCHTALPVIENAVSMAKKNALTVGQTLYVKEAIRVLSQYSGPMEQLIASAIVFHDANIDMMAGPDANNPYANRRLMEGPSGFMQAIANRGDGLTRLLNNLPAPAAGVATALNAITPAQAYATVTPDQLAAVTPAQIGAAVFPLGQIGAITPAQVAAANLTQAQVNVIIPARGAAIAVNATPAQLNAVTANQLIAVGLADNQADRAKYVAAVIDSMHAIAVASGGLNQMALKNILTNEVTRALVEQNNKGVIVTGQNLDERKLRTLVTTIADRIHSSDPGGSRANIPINIDDVVKLVTLADKAVEKSRSRG